jgi:hypothetical protein
MLSTLTPRVKRILLESRPQIVCLHGMPESLRVAAGPVWSELILIAKEAGWDPLPRLWLGVACDRVMEMVAAEVISHGMAVQRLGMVPDLAMNLNAELVCWDSEAACKLDPVKTGNVARELIRTTRGLFPRLPQAHTAYYVPTYHSETDQNGKPLLHGYPWSAWCGEGGVDVELPQVYIAPPEPETGPRIIASRGAMHAALQAHRESWVAAQKLGWIRFDLPVWMYGQLHDVPYQQTITYGSDPWHDTHPPCDGVDGYLFAGWTVASGHCDEHGEVALRALSELARRKLTVLQFQAYAGLDQDGICGPLTLRALGIPVPGK